MHSYGTTPDERRTVIFWLSVISVLIVYGIHALIKEIGGEFPWFVEVPGPVVVFAILFYCFDHHLWESIIFGRRLSRIPIFRGPWAGQLNSNLAGNETAYVSVDIQQTWSRISITLTARNSKAKSSMATVDLADGALHYEFLNEPAALAPATMEIFRGTCTLEISKDKINGSYYTGRGRGTIGTLTLERNVGAA